MRLPLFLLAAAAALIAPQAASAAVGSATAYAPLTGHEPNFVASGADDNIWATSFDAKTIWKVTPGGAITEYPAGALGSPSSLTPRPDGGFYASGSEGVAALAADGSLTMVFDSHSCASCDVPAGLVLGADGRLYSGHKRFTLAPTPGVECLGKTSFVADCLGDEALFESPFPFGGNKGPGRPVKGPDDTIWFTVTKPTGPCPEAGVGRLTVSGSSYSYDFFARSDAAGPCPMDAIAVGSDGNLWYTNESRIGRLNQGGAADEPIEEFSDGISPNPRIADIAPGPDGNLWFTERNTNKVARITPGGLVTEFPGVASHAQPTSIVAGPDGNVWYAAAGAIVCVEVGAPCPGEKTLSLFITGEGSITAPGVTCPPSCSPRFATGTQVTLTATAASGYKFVAWTGACEGSGPCEVTMSGPKSVRATFAKLATGTPGEQIAPTPSGGESPASSPGAVPAPRTAAAGPRCRKGFKAKKLRGKVRCVKKKKKKPKRRGHRAG